MEMYLSVIGHLPGILNFTKNGAILRRDILVCVAGLGSCGVEELQHAAAYIFDLLQCALPS